MVELKKKDYYLPKPLVMMISKYLNNYDLSKMYIGSTYMMDCIQAHYKSIYLALDTN